MLEDFVHYPFILLGFPDGSDSKESGEGNGNPFQYSCLENSMGRGTVPGVTKSQTQLSDFHFSLIL